MTDLEGRLAGVIEETTRIIDARLIDDPSTLLVVNDDLHVALRSMNHFLATGEKIQQSGITEHLDKLQVMASAALASL